MKKCGIDWNSFAYVWRPDVNFCSDNTAHATFLALPYQYSLSVVIMTIEETFIGICMVSENTTLTTYNNIGREVFSGALPKSKNNNSCSFSTRQARFTPAFLQIVQGTD
jgi:hypothetical protein